MRTHTHRYVSFGSSRTPSTRSWAGILRRVAATGDVRAPHCCCHLTRRPYRQAPSCRRDGFGGVNQNCLSTLGPRWRGCSPTNHPRWSSGPESRDCLLTAMPGCGEPPPRLPRSSLHPRLPQAPGQWRRSCACSSTTGSKPAVKPTAPTSSPNATWLDATTMVDGLSSNQVRRHLNVGSLLHVRELCPLRPHAHRLLVEWRCDRCPARLGRGARRVALSWRAPVEHRGGVWLKRGLPKLEVALPASPVASSSYGTDPVDAYSVAMVALRTQGLRHIEIDGATTALRLLGDHRDELGHACTQTVNRLHGLLLELLPGEAKKVPVRRPGPRPARPRCGRGMSWAAPVDVWPLI